MRIFQFFARFWVTKVKPFPEKVTQSVRIYLNQNLGIGTFSENGFGATLSSKTNAMSILKEHFSFFCKFLSDEFETIFKKTDTKLSKRSNLKFGHKNLLRKWFWSNLELRTECERFKRAFFSFLQVFEWRKWNHFLRNWGKDLKSILIKVWP